MDTALLLMWIMVALIAAILAWYALSSARRWMQVRRAQRQWIPAPAKVLSSGFIPRPIGYKGAATSDLSIQYQYTAGGKDHIGSTYELGRLTKWHQWEADSFLNKYPPGAAVTAYHDPGEPSKSALVITSGNDALSTIVLSVLLVGGLLFWFIVGLPEFQQTQRDEEAFLTYTIGEERNSVKHCRKYADQIREFIETGDRQDRYQPFIDVCIKRFGRDFDYFAAKGEQKQRP